MRRPARHFGVLGPLQVLDGAVPIRVRAAKQRFLLAELLGRANQPVPAETLIDALWPVAPPASAAENLRAYVYHLRRALGDAERITRAPHGYALIVEPDELDAHRFERLAGLGRDALAADDPAGAVRMFREALAIWRGPAYNDARSSQLVDQESTRLEELRLTVTEECVEAELRLGRHAQLISELSALVATHPLRERFRAQLMLALYRSGRQAEALQVYRDARQLLVDELGLEPGPELRLLERSVLAGDVVSGLVAPAAEPLRPAPCLLPADIADFTGRADELAVLRAQFTPGPGTAVRLVAINGRPGVGKTALAVHFAHDMRNAFPDGQLYVNLHGAEPHPAEPAEVLARFLRALGVDGSCIPEGIDERAEVFRDRVNGRRLLVVLDNATGEDQVQPLLPGTASCAVLVTSRSRLSGLPGAHLVELDVLPADHAVELLGSIEGALRVATEPHTASELARLCGHLPLAVRIAGARLAARPHWTIAHAVERLADERRRLDELVHGHLDVRASLTLSYRSLDPDARLLFGLLGQLSAPDFAVWCAAALLDRSVADAAEVMDRLVDAHLIDPADDARTGQLRYRFHDLVRAYARERGAAEVPAAGRAAALTRVFGAWLALAERAHARQAGGDYMVIHGRAPRWLPDQATVTRLLADPLAWFESERSAIVSAVRQAAQLGLDELCWDLAVTAALLCEVRRHYDDWAQSHEDALAATRSAGNLRGEAAVLAELGELHLLQHHCAEAGDLLKQSVRAFAELGDRHGLAIAQLHLAVLDRTCGRYEASLHRFEQVVPMFHEIGDLGSKAFALRGIGQIYLELGQVELALPFLRKALATAGQAGARRLQTQVRFRLGELHLERGEIEPAEQSFQQVLDHVRQLGDRIGQAWALFGLGRTRLLQGRYGPAETLLWEALSITKDTGERTVQAGVLLALGQLHHRTGRLAKAADCLSDAVVIYRDINAPVSQARALELLGDVRDDEGDHDAANSAWNQAHTLVERMDTETRIRASEKTSRKSRSAREPARDVAYEPAAALDHTPPVPAEVTRRTSYPCGLTIRHDRRP